jgi:hypothetical protein
MLRLLLGCNLVSLLGMQLVTLLLRVAAAERVLRMVAVAAAVAVQAAY